MQKPSQNPERGERPYDRLIDAVANPHPTATPSTTSEAHRLTNSQNARRPASSANMT